MTKAKLFIKERNYMENIDIQQIKFEPNMDSLLAELNDLLPLDKESLKQCLNYALTLGSDNEIHQYFSGLVGESDLFFNFLEHFLDFKKKGSVNDSHNKPKQSYLAATQNVKTQPHKSSNKQRNVNRSNTNKNNGTKITKITTTTQPITIANHHESISKTGPQKLEDSKEKKLSQKRKEVIQKTTIEDLDDLIRKLEIEEKTSDETECDCMAVRHPLNSVIPNCLNCGKIICVKERNRVTCSFCKAPLISLNEKLEMIRLLQKEKEAILEIEKTKKEDIQKDKAKRKQKKITINIGSVGSKNFYKEQDDLFAKLGKKADTNSTSDIKKVDEDLNTAKNTLRQLLDFQDNAVQRTKIIDQVSDYDVSNETSIWNKSSLDRILALKKQQRNFKKLEKQRLERSGRGKRVMELNIKNGKAVMKSKSVLDPSLQRQDQYYDYDSCSSDLAVDSEDEELKKEINAVTEKIKGQERIRDEEIAKKKYDYEKEVNIWKARKPKYIGLLKSNSGLDSDDIDLKYDRIQDFKDAAPVEELVLNL